MKGTPMKLVGVISTAVLSLTLGAAAPVYAQQDQHDQQEEQKVQPAQDEKKAQPDKPVKPEEKGMQPPEKNAKPEEKSARQPEKSAKPEERNAQQDNNSKPEEKNAKQQQMEAKPGEPAQRASGNSNGRIPDDRYKANFGSEHTFRVTQGDYNNRRFQYGGYSFGFVGEWPSNWLYTQNLYVIDIDGVYYLCNPAYPGVNIALSVNL
jgi:outer membrane biosynthesis protein TonB